MLSTYRAPLLGKPEKAANASKPAGLDGGALQSRSREYLERVVTAIQPLSKKQPVVLVWEDTRSAAAGLQSEKQALGRY